MCRECRTRCAGLFAPYFLPIKFKDVFSLNAQERYLFLGKAVGEENIALFVKGRELIGGQFHDALPGNSAVLRLLHPFYRLPWRTPTPVRPAVPQCGTDREMPHILIRLARGSGLRAVQQCREGHDLASL